MQQPSPSGQPPPPSQPSNQQQPSPNMHMAQQQQQMQIQQQQQMQIQRQQMHMQQQQQIQLQQQQRQLGMSQQQSAPQQQRMTHPASVQSRINFSGGQNSGQPMVQIISRHPTGGNPQTIQIAPAGSGQQAKIAPATGLTIGTMPGARPQLAPAGKVIIAAAGQPGGGGSANGPAVILPQATRPIAPGPPSQMRGGLPAAAAAAHDLAGTRAVPLPPMKNPELLERKRIHDLVNEVDPGQQVEDEVSNLLLQIADDFIERAVSSCCTIAKHRKSSSVQLKDVQLFLERNYNMSVPGFTPEEAARPAPATPTAAAAAAVSAKKTSFGNEAHRQRMAALLKKTVKK